MKEATSGKKAIKQSTLTLSLTATSVALIILCCISFYFIVASHNRVDKAAATRYELFYNAKRFMEASMYLTNEVRAYAATGDTVHYENYKHEVTEAKNRDIAVENMRKLGITYHEGALVTEMYALSNNLVPLEEASMVLSAAGDNAGALDSVYGWSYEDWVARIRSAQEKFIVMLDDRTEAELLAERSATYIWTIINLLCLAVTAILQIYSVVAVRSRVIRPLLMVRDEMLEIERGNLRSSFDATPDTSEMGMLIGSMQATKAELSTYIREISAKLAAIADGDSTAHIDTHYPGDFMQIKTSINEISSILTAQREQDERSREALRAAYEEANAANRAKSNFLSNMSHEMRTPMNAILGMTHIALASDDTVRRDQCLHKIDDASNHLLGVINDILDMSKIDSGKFELSPTDFNFEKMLIRVVNIINFRVDEKRQRLNVHLDPRVPVSIVSDDQRLAQVITNLLSNAVKFTPEKGEISVTIRLLSEDAHGCRLYVAVADTGIGISPEQQQKLFTSFSQADAGITRRFGGTGLGLAISKSIVEKMDGRIWVESEVGKGSTFSFEFTAARGTQTEEPQAQLHGVKWDALRVMVVDDDPAICEYFRNIAQRYHFHCDAAANGTEAYAMLTAANRYDIFFIDWKMPGLNGIELSQKIRDMGVENAVIVMISSTEWSEIERDARAAGANRFIPKPLFMSVIVDMIGECLGAEMRMEKQGDADVPDFSAYHILLAEDNEINQEIVIALLEPTGIGITSAENGAVALRLFAQAPERFDMIFMDMQMPEMDGTAATAGIRALEHPYASQIPIVAMTANVFREDIERCLEIGMNDHLGKPLDFSDVLEKMKKYLGRQK